MRSFVNAPTREDVFVLWSGYGNLSGAVGGKGRAWLITPDPHNSDAPVELRFATNGARGQVEYRSFPVTSADLRGAKSMSAIIDLRGTQQQVHFLAAPCVCGAGAVGHAGPQATRYQVTNVVPTSNRAVKVLS